jgi:type I restriction enzyme S subunit
MAVSSWTPTRLGELIEIKHGWPFKSEFFNEDLTGRPIVVNIGNFVYTGGFRFESTSVKEYRDNYPKDFELSPGDILLVMTCQTAGGEILGIPARVPNDGRLYLHNQRLGKVIIKDQQYVCSDYLYRLFLWKEFNRALVTTASGTKILHTAPSRIEAFVFNLPPLREQEAIAHILGTLDDKIELNRRMNESLEAMARAIFTSWFVDFDPVRAKAEGRDPVLPQSIADLFPDCFEGSELGDIPAGWQVKPVSYLAEAVGGSTPSTKDAAYWEGGRHCWATPKDLSTLSVPVLLDTERRITDRGLTHISSGLLPAGTVLMSSRAPIGYLAIAEVPVAINQGFIALKPKADVSNLFILWWAQSAQHEIVSRANGSTFLEINKANFRTIPTVVPDAPVMDLFERIVRPLYARVVASEREATTLAALRDTLLPKLISGEVRVPEAARVMEAAGG